MGRLTEIKAEVKTLIEAITITNGFSFDFGTVNGGGINPTKPSFDFTFVSELPDGEYGAYHGKDVASFEGVLECDQTDQVPDVPLHGADTGYDTVIAAIKSKFRANLGALPITKEGVVKYRGFRKLYSKAGDIFSPYKVSISFDVYYQSSEA